MSCRTSGTNSVLLDVINPARHYPGEGEEDITGNEIISSRASVPCLPKSAQNSLSRKPVYTADPSLANSGNLDLLMELL